MSVLKLKFKKDYLNLKANEESGKKQLSKRGTE
jgi:hypothetical protein